MKTYPIEIIKLAEKLNLKKSLNRFSDNYVSKKNIKNREIIVNATFFLDHSSVFRERLWYIINDIHLRVLCKQCGINPVKFHFRKFRDFCSLKCSSNNKKTVQQRKETKLKKYGDENFANVEKAQQTKLKKYGDENYNNRERYKETCLEKFGANNPYQVKEIKENIKETKLKKYGNENFLNIEKAKLTQYSNYHKKFIKLGNELYNKQYAYPELKTSHDEISIWCKDHGEFKTKMYYHLYRRSGCIGCEPLLSRYSKISIEWLNYISEKENIYIQHAENDGELIISVPNSKKYYFADGYCKETNTIYEFNGDIFHGNPNIFEDDDKPNYFNKDKTAKELYEKTLEKEKVLKSLGYNVISIWESEWNEIKNSVVINT